MNQAGTQTDLPNPGIAVDGVSVSFPLYQNSARSLKKKTVIAAASGRLGEDRKSRIVVEALRNISFRVNAGDRLGLIGANGAGKTTLLRTLAGIYEPVAGRVRVKGSFSALLDPNLGMNLELTGRENIMLRGLYNGLSRPMRSQLERDVAEFAQLGDFLDLPVRIYSAGMIVRLGFALATSVRPQILIMDEWVMAGDADFMERARLRQEAMVRSAEIFILSSHDIDVVRKWCSRVIWLDQARLVLDGSPDRVISEYLGHFALSREAKLAG